MVIQQSNTASLLFSILFTGSCKLTKKGVLYRGRARNTKGGIPCQDWSSQSPHRHSFQPEKYRTMRLKRNYCRNPDNEPEGPWCYTASKKLRWDYCDVPMCSGNFILLPLTCNIAIIHQFKCLLNDIKLHISFWYGYLTIKKRLSPLRHITMDANRQLTWVKDLWDMNLKARKFLTTINIITNKLWWGKYKG